MQEEILNILIYDINLLYYYLLQASVHVSTYSPCQIKRQNCCIAKIVGKFYRKSHL